MADIKTLVTIFLGIWTLVIVCIVVGMYATWEAKMLGDNNGGRGELGTTEPLGKNNLLERRNMYLSQVLFLKMPN